MKQSLSWSLWHAVPVTVLSLSRPQKQNLTLNQSVTFSVNFMAHLKHNVRVRWFKNNVALPGTDSRIVTSFVYVLGEGMSTSLSLPSVGISDAGIYTVVISTELSLMQGGSPVFSSSGDASFQVNIITPGESI